MYVYTLFGTTYIWMWLYFYLWSKIRGYFKIYFYYLALFSFSQLCLVCALHSFLMSTDNLCYIEPFWKSHLECDMLSVLKEESTMNWEDEITFLSLLSGSKVPTGEVPLRTAGLTLSLISPSLPQGMPQHYSLAWCFVINKTTPEKWRRWDGEKATLVRGLKVHDQKFYFCLREIQESSQTFLRRQGL